ncbi:helix-turn-helix transcriptional regulator [Streptosporangium sp. NPDC049376]|uniref:helix-turn-helix transcriptional regulator n=1 Tax=Streptosporangium sp. NPDC049376 TaxID=3366192 RepID=UPI0037AEED7C
MARSVDNPLALGVLGLLLERPMHPYEMVVVLRERGKDASVRINRGSLYDVVTALEGEGWIVEKARVQEGNRPARTVYAITEAGRDAFVRRLDEQIRVPRREYPLFLTAVAYLGALGPERAWAALLERAERLRAAMAEDRRALDDALASGQVPRLFVIEAEYALHMTRGELDWVTGTAEEIRTGSLTWPDDRKDLT